MAAWAGTHPQVVSSWENRKELHLLARHVRGLLGALGPEVWELAGDALLGAMEYAEDREGLAPVVAALVGAFTDLTEEGRDISEREERPTWRLRRMPTLEEVAAKMGRTPPFDVLELHTLGSLVELTNFLRGWDAVIETDAERRRRIRRLEAEIESLR